MLLLLKCINFVRSRSCSKALKSIFFVLLVTSKNEPKSSEKKYYSIFTLCVPSTTLVRFKTSFGEQKNKDQQQQQQKIWMEMPNGLEMVWLSLRLRQNVPNATQRENGVNEREKARNHTLHAHPFVSYLFGCSIWFFIRHSHTGTMTIRFWYCFYI